jgi:hypothetical protein
MCIHRTTAPRSTRKSGRMSLAPDAAGVHHGTPAALDPGSGRIQIAV